MIVYLAGETGDSPEHHEELAAKAIAFGHGYALKGANHFLFSFAYEEAKRRAEYFCKQPRRRIFIDSGAYTAWTGKCEPIVNRKYLDWCKKVMDSKQCPVVFAALDVIAGKITDSKWPPSREDSERACEKGWANYQAMKQEGIGPCLMTFHQFDDPKWLTMLKDESDYFAVSHSKRRDVPDALKNKWIKDVFDTVKPLDKSSGTARLTKKIHGLGVTRIEWMKEYPFYSVDSTAWLQAGKGNLTSICGPSGQVHTRSLKVWTRRAAANGILGDLENGVSPKNMKYFRECLGIVPGVDDRNGNWGSYFKLIQSMGAYMEQEYFVTKYWREEKGLTLDHEPPERQRENEPPIAEVLAELEALERQNARWNAKVEKQIRDPEVAEWLGLKEKKAQRK